MTIIVFQTKFITWCIVWNGYTTLYKCWGATVLHALYSGDMCPVKTCAVQVHRKKFMKQLFYIERPNYNLHLVEIRYSSFYLWSPWPTDLKSHLLVSSYTFCIISIILFNIYMKYCTFIDIFYIFEMATDQSILKSHLLFKILENH